MLLCELTTVDILNGTASIINLPAHILQAYDVCIKLKLIGFIFDEFERFFVVCSWYSKKKYNNYINYFKGDKEREQRRGQVHITQAKMSLQDKE